MMNQQCGADISFLPAMLHDLHQQVGRVQNSMDDLVELSSCYQISPLVRRLTHGALCNESAYGLTWIYASSIVICVLCFILLTTRAALFNPIKAKKKREKKPKRIAIKEFNEYKEFHSEFYKDANEWAMEPAGKKAVSGSNKIVFDFGSQIAMNPTFETQVTTRLSQDELDQLSNGADMNRLFVDEDDESSWGSSYESLSDESDSSSNDGDAHGDDDDDDSQSALTSFLSETKSIAMQSIDKVRNIASMLRTTAKSRLLGNHNDEEESIDDGVGMFLPNLNVKTHHNQEYECDDRDDDKSIADDSLYTTSPTALGSATNKESHHRKDYSDGEEENDGLIRTVETPTNSRIRPLYGGSRIFSSLLTPMAPKKAVFALPRTKAAQIEAEDEEMQPLTASVSNANSPSTTGLSSAGPDSILNPRLLKLSPAASPNRRLERPLRNSIETFPIRASQSNTPPPPRRRNQRQRLCSEDSDDISLYVDDEMEKVPPRPPQKSTRYHRRTRGGNTNSDKEA